MSASDSLCCQFWVESGHVPVHDGGWRCLSASGGRVECGESDVVELCERRGFLQRPWARCVGRRCASLYCEEWDSHFPAGEAQLDGGAYVVVGLSDGFHFSGVEVGYAPWVGSGSGSSGPLCVASPCVGRGGHNHACYSARQDVVCPRGSDGVRLAVVVGWVCLDVGCEDQYVELVGAYF